MGGWVSYVRRSSTRVDSYLEPPFLNRANGHPTTRYVAFQLWGVEGKRKWRESITKLKHYTLLGEVKSSTLSRRENYSD